MSKVVSTGSTTQLMAGFGSPSGGKKKKEKEQKLKPKQQWDRYSNLKNEPMVRVAVRVEGDDKNNDWLEVGRVKSKDNTNTEAAVAKQRVIIAEHSRRIYPLQLSKDTKVQWAYWQEEGDQWVVVDKSVLEGAVDGIEKEVGFEGRPDPASGFYCMYKEGRLVDTSTDGKAI
jgi:hypothetical protein